jgi:hypothetical protein
MLKDKIKEAEINSLCAEMSTVRHSEDMSQEDKDRRMAEIEARITLLKGGEKRKIGGIGVKQI